MWAMRLCQWVCILWLKTTVPDGSFTNPWWCSPDADHLENTILLTITDDPDAKTSHYQNHIHFHFLTEPFRKVLKNQETLKFTVTARSCPRVWLLLENSKFIIGDRYWQLFSLKWQTRFIFWEKRLPNSQAWITAICLSLVLSSKNDVYECTKRLVWLAPKRSIKVHLLRMIRVHREELLCILYCFYISQLVTLNNKVCIHQ